VVEDWPLQPLTLFYDWLYITALQQNKDILSDLLNYEAFTDIEYNPDKSVSCQARSAALYVSLSHEGLIEHGVPEKNIFIAHVAERGCATTQAQLF